MKAVILLILLFPLFLVAGKNNNSNEKMISVVKKHYQTAEKALNELDTETSKASVLKAISIIESYKLNQKEFAQIYIIAGVLNLMVEDGTEAVNHFKKALSMDSDVTIPENFSSAETLEIFEKARKELTKKSENDFLIDNVDYKIMFNPKKTHQQGEPFKTEVQISPLPPADYEILLKYMMDGGDYTEVKLTKIDQSYVGEVPASFIVGKFLNIYVTLKDSSGIEVASSGGIETPFIIKITTQIGKKTNVKINNNEDDLDSDNSDNSNKTSEIPKTVSHSVVAFNLDFGTGLGVPTGKTMYLKQEVGSGFAWSPMFIGGDLSFFITEDILLGFGTRIQTMEKDWLVTLKIKLLLSQNENYRMFSTFGVNYGDVRYRVNVSENNPKQETDIIENGNLGVNFGGSYVLLLSKNFGFITSFTSYILAPEFSIDFDFSAGIYLEF